MRKLLARLDKVGQTVETAMLVIMLSVMMLVAVGQIVMREVFGTGFGWAEELVSLIVLWLALVGSIAACRENRHIRIDALSHVFPDSVIGFIRVLVDLFAAAVCGVIAVQAWRYLQIEIEYADVTTVLVDTPAWVAHSIMPVAFAFISYRFVVSAIKQADESIFGNAEEGLE